jgi:hypothetical protein
VTLSDNITVSVSEDTKTDLLARLEEYANTDMHKEFSQLAEAIQWASHDPEELLRAIDLALSLELAALAMRLAQQGRTLFPCHERMQQAGRVLAPPVARHVKAYEEHSHSTSQNWLREHAAQYRGQWVAVRAGTFLGAADSLADLMPAIDQDAEASNTLVTKVL